MIWLAHPCICWMRAWDVECVSDDRMSEMCTVDTDLMPKSTSDAERNDTGITDWVVLIERVECLSRVSFFAN